VSVKVYWYCVRLNRPPILMSWPACNEEFGALHLGNLGAQPLDDLIGGNVTLSNGFNCMNTRAIVFGRIVSIGAAQHENAL